MPGNAQFISLIMCAICLSFLSGCATPYQATVADANAGRMPPGYHWATPAQKAESAAVLQRWRDANPNECWGGTDSAAIEHNRRYGFSSVTSNAPSSSSPNNSPSSGPSVSSSPSSSQLASCTQCGGTGRVKHQDRWGSDSNGRLIDEYHWETCHWCHGVGAR